MFTFLSYRDPNLLKTVDVYDGTADFLRKLELDDDALTKVCFWACWLAHSCALQWWATGQGAPAIDQGTVVRASLSDAQKSQLLHLCTLAKSSCKLWLQHCLRLCMLFRSLSI